MTPGHQAYKVFIDDVNSTYQRIVTRTAEIQAERAADPSSGAVEQIQLQAVEPGSEIHINVPHAGSADPIEQQARAIFDTFPPGLQRALESGSLDRVNEVLGKMSVEEAEEVVSQMGEHGMLDMRQGVIDGTTDEGKEEVRLMQESAKAGFEAENHRIHVPEKDSAGKARATFETLPAEVQHALESGVMQQVEDALNKIGGQEAHALLSKLGEQGVLDLQDKTEGSAANDPAQALESKASELEVAEVD